MIPLVWWGLFFGLFIILELSSPGYFFFLSFAVGSLAAALVSLVSSSLTVQLFACCVVALTAFFFLRRFAAQVALTGTVQTNVYALPGKKGIVIDTITPLHRGWIKIDGEIWAAAPLENVSIEKDAIVEVVSIVGSHLRVKQIAHHPKEGDRL